MRWRARVLAGERPEGDALAKVEGAPAKAFIDIAGRPMIATAKIIRPYGRANRVLWPPPLRPCILTTR